jgi:hypothetical protein
MMGNSPLLLSFFDRISSYFLVIEPVTTDTDSTKFQSVDGTNPTTMGKLDANATDKEAASSGACHHEGGPRSLGSQGPWVRSNLTRQRLPSLIGDLGRAPGHCGVRPRMSRRLGLFLGSIGLRHERVDG